MPTFFKVILCFTWRGSGPLSHIHHPCILKVMFCLECFRVVFQQEKPGQTAGDLEGGSVGIHWSTPLSARWEWPVPPPQPLQGCSITTPVWAGQGDTRGSLLNFQPPGSVQAPTSKAAQTCGSWHLLKVNSDTLYSSIFFLILWKQLHVTEAFKTLPFI